MAAARSAPGDKGFVLDDYALYNLNRAAATYNEEMAKALKAYELDVMEWRILMLLDDKNPSSVGELARRSVSKMPTVTRMLTRMEEQGLVKRKALSGDRRIVEIFITPKARKALQMVQTIGKGVYQRAFESINAGDIARVTTTLKKIRENLSRSPYEQPAPKKI